MEIVKIKFKFGPLSLKRLEKVQPNLVKHISLRYSNNRRFKNC